MTPWMVPTDDAVSSLFVVYESPRDFPRQWVIRQHLVGSKGSVPTACHIAAADLATVRSFLPSGLHRIDRHPEDDPVIREIWADPGLVAQLRAAS